MKLKRRVVSLYLAKEMFKFGFRQKSLWYWHERITDKKNAHIIGSGLTKYKGKNICFSSDRKDRLYSAYTVAELGGMLPDCITFHKQICWLQIDKFYNVWSIYYKSYGQYKIITTRIMKSVTEANARANMLIYLKKEGLL